jgi:hypothetical protein
VLFGHAHALRESIDAPVESFNQGRYERDVDSVRAAIEASDFTQCWRRGELTPTNEVVAVALGVEAEQLPGVLRAAIGQQ